MHLIIVICMFINARRLFSSFLKSECKKSITLYPLYGVISLQRFHKQLNHNFINYLVMTFCIKKLIHFPWRG